MSIVTFSRLTPRIITTPTGVVGPLGSGASSRYPNQIDEFVPVPEPVAPATEIGHYHYASDYRLLWGAIVAIQNTLGINPAGNAGTLAGRLYGQGNISEDASSVGYDRFQRGWVTIASNIMTDDPTQVAIDLSTKTFTGVETGYGDGKPIVFARVGQRNDTDAWHTTGPWRLALVDNSDRNNNKFRFAGRNISGGAVGAGDTQNIFMGFIAVNWKMK